MTLLQNTHSPRPAQLKAGIGFRHLLLIAALSISGCAMQIKQLPQQAKIEVPESWQADQSKNSGEPSADAAATTLESIEVENGWLNSFADEDLKDHVQAALNNNPDLLGSASQLILPRNSSAQAA